MIGKFFIGVGALFLALYPVQGVKMITMGPGRFGPAAQFVRTTWLPLYMKHYHFALHVL